MISKNSKYLYTYYWFSLSQTKEACAMPGGKTVIEGPNGMCILKNK